MTNRRLSEAAAASILIALLGVYVTCKLYTVKKHQGVSALEMERLTLIGRAAKVTRPLPYFFFKERFCFIPVINDLDQSTTLIYSGVRV